MIFVAGEITDEACRKELIETALNEFKHIDVLVSVTERASYSN